MRCLLRLTALQDQEFNSAYHVKVQGVVYDILRDAGYETIHDKHPFKFLSFSCEMPPQDMVEGDTRSFIIASPNKNLIKDVASVASGRDLFEPGDRRYRIDDVEVFEDTIPEQGRLITNTPIVVRIPARRCREEYGIDPKGYDDVFWRLDQDHSADAFIEEVERNLEAKYEEYYDREPPERPYLTGYQPRKSVAVPVHYDDRTVMMFGSTWEFDFEAQTRAKQRLIHLGLESGVGELNTTGFGFMNLKDQV